MMYVRVSEIFCVFLLAFLIILNGRKTVLNRFHAQVGFHCDVLDVSD